MMIKRLLFAIGILSLSACGDRSGSATDPGGDPTRETYATSLGVNIAEMTKTPFGTYYKDLTVGAGATLIDPKASTNNVDFIGYLVNGTQFEAETGFSFTPGSVVTGLADGMVGMKVGGTRLIVVPANLGYGTSIQHTPTVTIPPNSTLVFRVKLNSFRG